MSALPLELGALPPSGNDEDDWYGSGRVVYRSMFCHSCGARTAMWECTIGCFGRCPGCSSLSVEPSPVPVDGNRSNDSDSEDDSDMDTPDQLDIVNMINLMPDPSLLDEQACSVLLPMLFAYESGDLSDDELFLHIVKEVVKKLTRLREDGRQLTRAATGAIRIPSIRQSVCYEQLKRLKVETFAAVAGESRDVDLKWELNLDNVEGIPSIISLRGLIPGGLKEWKTAQPSSQCSVCSGDIAPNDWVIKLDCCHVFHKQCILRWFWSNHTCPVCRFELHTDNAKFFRSIGEAYLASCVERSEEQNRKECLSEILKKLRRARAAEEARRVVKGVVERAMRRATLFQRFRNPSFWRLPPEVVARIGSVLQSDRKGEGQGKEREQAKGGLVEDQVCRVPADGEERAVGLGREEGERKDEKRECPASMSKEAYELEMSGFWDEGEDREVKGSPSLISVESIPGLLPENCVKVSDPEESDQLPDLDPPESEADNESPMAEEKVEEVEGGPDEAGGGAVKEKEEASDDAPPSQEVGIDEKAASEPDEEVGGNSGDEEPCKEAPLPASSKERSEVKERPEPAIEPYLAHILRRSTLGNLEAPSASKEAESSDKRMRWGSHRTFSGPSVSSSRLNNLRVSSLRSFGAPLPSLGSSPSGAAPWRPSEPSGGSSSHFRRRQNSLVGTRRSRLPRIEHPLFQGGRMHPLS